MNKIYKKFIAFSLAVMAVTAFAGCDNSESSSQTDTTVAQTTVTPTTVAQINDNTTDIKALHYYSEDGDDIAGAWKITEGEGSQYENFVYMFDGKGKATLYVDNVGYLENYTLDESKKTFEATLMFGINGSYTYKVSDDKKSIEFTNTETKDKSTLTRIENFTMLPQAENAPKIDDKILGAWLSESGEYIYFGADGYMYDYLYGMTVTYSNYNAVDGVITSKYTMYDEILTDTYEYSVNGNALTLNGTVYNKIPASELV